MIEQFIWSVAPLRYHIKKYLHCLLCCLCVTLTAAAQEENISYHFRHLDISNGLASNHVSAILQDRKGFIWIASTALQRYDGTNLVTMANFDRVPGSIYYDDICLCEDSRGRIWMGTPDNIRVYDPVTMLIRTLKVANRAELPEGLQCSNIIQDHNGVIWATTRDGLMQFDEASFSFHKAAMIPEADRLEMQDAIMEDESGNLWISGTTHLYILDHDRKQLYSPANNPRHLPVLDIHNSFKKIYTDNRHHIWMAGRQGILYQYDPAVNRLQEYRFNTPDTDHIFDVMTDGNKDLWVATEKGGIFRFNDSLRRFDFNITSNNADERGFHYDYEANCMLSDREGHLWIGTDRGVNILSIHNTSFRMLDHRTVFQKTKERLPAAEVTGIFQASNGDVYVGYWGKGFSRLSSRLQLLGNYFHGEDTATTIPEQRGLVWTFAELKNGTILVGQENGNLSLFNPATGRFIRHLTSPALHEQTLLRMLVQGDTAVWIGLYKRGLASWNPRANEFRYYHEITDSLKRPLSVLQIVPEKDSLLWLASSGGGLILFNPHTRKIIARQNFEWLQHSYNNVTSLVRFNDSTLLAGTDHGLWMYNTRQGTYVPVRIDGQLFDEWVLNIREDTPEKFWFITPYGFYRYTIPRGKLETFTQNDDIIDNSRKVRRRISWLKDGRLLVGASDHFVVFEPNKLEVAPPPPDVTIVNMKALDSIILIEEALRGNTPVELNHRQNIISIEFKSLSYHQEKIRYFYQLEGLDEDWVSAENILVAKYTNLAPGNYTFRVRAVNAAGTTSLHISELKIFIRPAFWQTPWFRVLCLLLALGLVYLYIRLRITSVKKEARERAAIQQQMAQLEMKALRAQMNPHFIFNALNSIQTFMMKSETEQALAYLARFARLIRNVLDNSQLNNIPVSKEVNMLTNYLELEKLRFADAFEYEFVVDPELEQDFVEIPTMILQPFVENAIWHGILHIPDQGKIRIMFARVGDRVLCTIEDNGIGRAKSAALRKMDTQHYSRGLQITRDRLQLYNSRFNMDASFDIEDLNDGAGNATGTRVNIWFPYVHE
ncbi:histidine kinase [Chitinophaga varians]|uniref:Histidine kinase n=1 Tax=Chitinophaga varians TaxID=2202339 RepID=A0A847RRH2_9BACT|nr:sensor histidine kinase [Chitinophaga varians]NLR65532.1 histidine kinase [Chitinophaga varians]